MLQRDASAAAVVKTWRSPPSSSPAWQQATPLAENSSHLPPPPPAYTQHNQHPKHQGQAWANREHREGEIHTQRQCRQADAANPILSTARVPAHCCCCCCATHQQAPQRGGRDHSWEWAHTRVPYTLALPPGTLPVPAHPCAKKRQLYAHTPGCHPPTSSLHPSSSCSAA